MLCGSIVATVVVVFHSKSPFVACLSNVNSKLCIFSSRTLVSFKSNCYSASIEVSKMIKTEEHSFIFHLELGGAYSIYINLTLSF